MGIDSERVADSGNEALLKGFDVLFRDAIHMVPEPLTGKRRLRKPPQSAKDRRLVPIADGQFAARIQGSVQGRQQEVVADRRPLLAFGQDVVEKFQQPESLGNTQQRSHPSRLEDDRFFRLGRFRLFGPFDNRLDRAEVLLPDNARFAVNPFGFNGVVIRPSLFDLLDDGRHRISPSPDSMDE